MQKFSVLLLVLLSASLSCVFGQDLPTDLPLSELSAKAHLEQTIGVTQVSLDYYRPNKLAASLAIKLGFGNQLLQCRLWAYHKEYDKALAQLDRLGESYPQFMTIVSAFKKRWEVAQKL